MNNFHKAIKCIRKYTSKPRVIQTQLNGTQLVGVLNNPTDECFSELLDKCLEADMRWYLMGHGSKINLIVTL